MPPKKPQLTNKSHCSGARARKDQHAFEMAKHRAAKAAALREEVGDIEEDVVPYEHKGGQAGESIRLKRLKPSPASDDVGNSKTTTCFADRNTSVACAAGTGNTEPAISSPAPSASKKQAPGHNKRNWQIMEQQQTGASPSSRVYSHSWPQRNGGGTTVDIRGNVTPSASDSKRTLRGKKKLLQDVCTDLGTLSKARIVAIHPDDVVDFQEP